jgi:hypothetical protein
MPPESKILGEVKIQKPSPNENNNLNQVNNEQANNTIRMYQRKKRKNV